MHFVDLVNAFRVRSLSTSSQSSPYLFTVAMQSILSNYDVLLEIFSNLRIVKPFDIPQSEQLTPRPYAYWGPSVRREVLHRQYPEKEANEERERRGALFNAALVCKTFSEIALDELWAAPLGGLYTVLSLLSNVKIEKHSFMTAKFGIKMHEIHGYVRLYSNQSAHFR